MIKYNVAHYTTLATLTTLAGALLYHMHDIQSAITVLFRL